MYRYDDEPFVSSSVFISSLELSDTKVYETSARAVLGTTTHFCRVVVLKLRAVPIGTALSLRVLRLIRRGAQAMYKRGLNLRTTSLQKLLGTAALL